MKDEESLQEKIIAAIFEASHDLILIYDRDGRIIRFNHECEKVSGYCINEVQSTSIWDFALDQENARRTKALYKKARDSRDLSVLHEPYEDYWITKQGEHRRISWTTRLILNEDGAPDYIIRIGKDITQQRIMKKKLLKSKAELHSIFENANGIIYTLSAEGRFIFVSRGWKETLGHEIDEVQGQLIDRFVHPDYLPVCYDYLSHIMTNGEAHYSIEYKVMHSDGTWRWHTSTGASVKDEDGTPIYYVGLAVDITDRKVMENALRLSEEKFFKAFRSNPDPITIRTLEEGLYMEVNDAWIDTTGCPRSEAIGCTSTEIGIWSEPDKYDQMLKKIMEQGSIRNFEICHGMKSGEIRSFLVSAEIIEMEKQPCLLCVHKDITERNKTEEEIKYLSFYDKLTGLYNRAFFEEELKKLDNGRTLPLSLIMGDVNGLKLINDALGHWEGDKLLIKVAEILKKSCRNEDCIARWGGDEFIILLPGLDDKNASRVFERIKNACKSIEGFPIQTSISLGLATKNSDTQDIRGVIKEAEDKMYRNKLLESRSIRSTFLFSLEKTLWSRSHETKEHCQRLQRITQKIGRALSLPDSELDNLKLLAALHDIGKIAIPNNILNNPGKLSSEEWETMKKHTEIGYRIAISSPEMAPIAEAILHHHERWDGSGYPLGLKGEDIPLISRIIAIADTYDVMTHGRPYQKAVSKEAARREILKCAGIQFDPDLVKISMEVLGAGI